jgi:FkbM family methyltransferase
MDFNKNYSLRDSDNLFLDDKIDKLFGGKQDGFFIELGANNGLLQSNTAFLEKNRNWKGILIEPNTKNFEFCKINRPNSICYNYACVSQDFTDEFIYGDFDLPPNDNGSLMSSINVLRLNSKKCDILKVPVSTLTNILDKQTIPKIDFLSLDVEGYEYSVLKGLDLDKYKPTYLLIEIYNVDFNTIKTYLEDKKYKLISNFSNYSKQTNPNWDGTHNDFLFKLSDVNA